VAWEAWRDLVEWLARHPDGGLQDAAQLAGFGQIPDGWHDRVDELQRDAAGPSDSERRERWLVGRAMDELRGRVPATEVAGLVRDLVPAEHGEPVA
jgi:hypothetical protein